MEADHDALARGARGASLSRKPSFRAGSSLLRGVVATLLIGAASVSAIGQSSSLYLRQEPAASASVVGEGQLSPAIAANSFVAVSIPLPRQFTENDLVTIIIRESFQTDLKASLDTEKDMKIEGEVTDFPNLDKLLELVLEQDDFAGGEPKVGVDLSNEFQGEGDYSRSESMTGRITARIADVKPNGTLVLEARQMVAHDKEELTIVLSGTCRAADITADNTVLSTELYDLHMSKQHQGELKKTTRKGLITRFLEGLFNF